MGHSRFQGHVLSAGLIVAGLAAATAMPAWAFGVVSPGQGALPDAGEAVEIIQVATAGRAEADGDGAGDEVDDGEIRTIFDGVFTEEQAAAGRGHYMSTCVNCHENTARGGPAAPGLIAYTLNNKYAGLPLFAYFDYMRQNMPPGQSGWFLDKEYAEIVAFLLEMHGAPAGETELPSDEEGLSAIMIVRAP